NSRLDQLQAAVRRAKLHDHDPWHEGRRKVAEFYLASIRNPLVILPDGSDLREQAWHLFVVRTPKRHALRDHLTQHGISTQIHYPRPPHLQGAYAQDGWQAGDLPIAEQLSGEVLSLPMDPLMTREQMQWCAKQVNAFSGQELS
ncbi:MAG: DegT/DnrJ/EryC1/StrS family aminotransferase, partial [Burkholderiales bacterium]|nr:DegT/DnrJ/EryC1/StrS family aminotransferase [Burkholderiales bacterium]MCW5622802.1 DegT/DnrJ/EryC1/StrS family aminotransferase [Burkholderiales bacterium]